MAAEGIFNRTISILSNALDLRSLRHKIIVSNIANMDTPNYQAFDIVMGEELGSTLNPQKNIELVHTQPAHLPSRDARAPKVIATSSGVEGADHNSVDINKTMVTLAENGIMYNALAEIIGKRFQGLKNAIQEGRK